MKRNLYIDDESIVIRQSGINLDLPVHAFATKAFRVAGSTSELFFPGLRWRSRDGYAYLIERPPEIIEIFYQDGKPHSEAPQRMISLPIPWTVWFFIKNPGNSGGFNDVPQCFIRTAQITSPDDPLFRLPLPNMYPDGQFCGGSSTQSFYNGTKAETNIINLMQQFIDTFWNSTFNLDLGTTQECNAGVPPSLLVGNGRGWLDQWADLTLDEALGVPWVSSGLHLTVGKLIERYERAPLQPALSESHSPVSFLGGVAQ